MADACEKTFKNLLIQIGSQNLYWRNLFVMLQWEANVGAGKHILKIYRIYFA